MAKKRQEEAPAGAPAWMATFSDLMNLLLCFFVLLYSMSSVDAGKFEQIAESFNKTFSIFSGGATAIGEGILISNGVSQLNELDQYINSTGKTADSEVDSDQLEEYEYMAGQVEQQQLAESEALAEQIEEAVQENNLSDQISIEFTSQYVQLTLKGAILFDSGQTDIRSEAIPIMDKVGVILERYSKGVVEIEGHTDNVPVSSNSRFADNNELSSSRALSIFKYLVDTTNLDPAMLKHSGRGEYVPIADNSTEEGRAKNRRVEIRIYHAADAYE